jgi:hypothetical protein
MASYNTNLKNWGATGTEYPDGYSYVEGEQPVDDWDNFIIDNLIEDVKDHLVPLTNSRIESDVGGTGGEPGTPEEAHLYQNTDTDRLEVWDTSTSSWYTHLRRDGDQMQGVLDMGGYEINDSTGDLNLDGTVSVSGNITLTGTVDGVDVSSLESDFTSHDHDGRYYTQTYVDNNSAETPHGTKITTQEDNNSSTPISFNFNLSEYSSYFISVESTSLVDTSDYLRINFNNNTEDYVWQGYQNDGSKIGGVTCRVGGDTGSVNNTIFIGGLYIYEASNKIYGSVTGTSGDLESTLQNFKYDKNNTINSLQLTTYENATAEATVYGLE